MVFELFFYSVLLRDSASQEFWQLERTLVAVALVERWSLRRVKMLKSECMHRSLGQDSGRLLMYGLDCTIEQ